MVWTWRVVWKVGWRWIPAIPGGPKPEPGPLWWGPAWKQVGEAVKVGCRLDREQSPLVRCPSNLILTDRRLAHGKSIHQVLGLQSHWSSRPSSAPRALLAWGKGVERAQSIPSLTPQLPHRQPTCWMEKGLPVETRGGESKPRFSLAKGNRGKSQGEWLGAATPGPAALASQLHREPSWEWRGWFPGGTRVPRKAKQSQPHMWRSTTVRLNAFA